MGLSSPRKRGPIFQRPASVARWVPACAGTTAETNDSRDSDSQRQLRLLVATAAGAAGAGGLRGMRGEAPLHPHRLARAAVDHELHGAARAVRPGEIDALLDVDLVLVGVDGPDLLV